MANWFTKLAFSEQALIAACVSFWLSLVLVPLFFAWKPRATSVKLLSLALPVAGIFASALALVFLRFSGVNALTWSIATMGWCFALLATLVIPHVVSVFVKHERIVYGLSAAALIVGTLHFLYRAREAYIDQAQVITDFRRATEPMITRCCAGDSESCRLTAAAFEKVSKTTGYSGGNTDARNKYLAYTCRYSRAKEDCELFKNSVGVRDDEDYREHRLYIQGCDPKDVFNASFILSGD